MKKLSRNHTDRLRQGTKFNRSLSLGAFVLSISFLGVSCGGGSDDDEDETAAATTTTTTTPVASSSGSTTTTASKKLTDMYPVDLGLSLFPTATGPSLNLQGESVADGATAGESLINCSL